MSRSDESNAAPASAKQSRPVVHILGTRPATWLPIARALRQALEMAGVAVVLAADRDAADGHEGPSAAPMADFVALVDSPARVLAQWVASGEIGSALQILEAWRHSAAQLLKLVHRSTGRCLLIDVAEASAAPDGVAHALAGWHSALGALRLEFSAASPPDILCLTLAQHLCSTDIAAVDLFDELHAASVVIDDDATASAVQSVSADDAVSRYRALLALEGKHATPPLRNETGPSAAARDTVVRQADVPREEGPHVAGQIGAESR